VKIFCSTHPFGSVNTKPLEILKQNNIDIELNPYGRKIIPEELKIHLSDKSGLIAGTEKLNKEVLDCAPDLRIIARVGIGIDDIDFEETNRRGILVTYTPEAVSQAVAELTIGNMLNLARSIPQIHIGMKSGKWSRIIGFEIFNKKIGIIGFGRVGKRVAKMLQGFSCKILVNDISPDEEMGSMYHVQFCSKEEIFQNADIITLHVPKTTLTINLIDGKVLSSMKKSAFLINTSRGGIVNEEDLYYALKMGEIAGAAVDVYEIEPYVAGRLHELDNILLTCHSGSCSKEARYLMELGAAEEIVRFNNSQPLLFPVPEDLIKMEQTKLVIPVNAEWHEIINQSKENQDESYKIYRKKWGQYPAHSIVGPYPLNLDIELVYNHANVLDPVDIYLSSSSKKTSFMDWDLVMKIVDDLESTTDGVAVSFGFRGNSLYYPQITEALEAVKNIGSVETRISTISSYHNDKLMRNLIEKGLDTLNFYVAYHGSYNNPTKNEVEELERISRSLDNIRRHKAFLGTNYPRIRIFTDMDLSNENEIDEFARFWSHWADVVAVVDKSIKSSTNSFSNRNIKWACSRLWQRMVVTFDGEIIVCNYDFEGKFKLGSFPNTSISDAWNSEKMNWIRKMHRSNKSNELEPCRSCVFRSIEISKLLTTS